MSLSFLLSPMFLVVVGMLALVFLTTRDRRLIIKAVLALFCFSFLTGLTLYSLAYAPAHASMNQILLAALRGLFSTGAMFVGNNSVESCLRETDAAWLRSSVPLQTLFWFAHSVALVASACAALFIFGRRLSGEMALRFGRHKDVFIITGTHPNALLLGQNLASFDGRGVSLQEKRKRLIVFLADSLSNSTEFYDKTSSYGAVLIEYDAGLTGLADGRWSRAKGVSGDGSSLANSLRRAGLGCRFGQNRIYNIVLMSDHVQESVETILTYAKSRDIPSSSLKMYTLSDSELEKEAIERLSSQYPYDLHISDESSISARQLLLQYPLYQHIPFDGNGKARSCVTVMVVGFGRVGQRVLRGLVQSGQFVGAAQRAILVDKDMASLRGRFQHRFPEIGSLCELEFHQCDTRSNDFFERLQEIESVNYIVCALGNDDQNEQTACDLRLHFLRTRGKSPFIAVRSDDTDVLWQDKDTANDGAVLERGICFGRNRHIYTESAIIRGEIDAQAMMVNAVYCGRENAEFAEIQRLWYKLPWLSKESSRASADSIDAMLHLVGISREEAAMRSQLTDDKELTEILAETEHKRWNGFHAAMGYRAMPLDEMRRRRKLGMTPKDCTRDYEQKMHICLVPWDRLDAVTDAYNALWADGEDRKDYKNLDREIVKYIPLFVKASKRARDLQ